MGIVQADQDISFQSMKVKLGQVVDTIKSDRDVESVSAFTGSGTGSPVNTRPDVRRPQRLQRAKGHARTR